MSELAWLLLWNTLVASAIAGVALVVWRRLHRTAIAHALLLVALVKLVTPGVFGLAVPQLVPQLGGDETRVAAAADDAGGQPAAGAVVEFLIVADEVPQALPADELWGGRPWADVAEEFVPPPVWRPEELPAELSAELPPAGVVIRPLVREADGGAAELATGLATDGTAAGTAAGFDWSTVLWSAWLLGTLIVGALIFRRGQRCDLLLRHAEVADASVRETVARLAGELGLARVPDVRVVDARVSPFVFRWRGRSTVVLSSVVVRELEPEELSAVIAHELCHLAGGDHRVRMLELCVALVHWWNPVAHWVRQLLRQAEELRCDSRAVALMGGSARRYGRSILKAASHLEGDLRGLPLTASGLGGADTLKKRLQMIARQDFDHRLSMWAKAGLLAGATALLPLGLTAQEDVKVVKKTKAEVKADVVKKLKEALGKSGAGAEIDVEAIKKAIGGDGEVIVVREEAGDGDQDPKKVRVRVEKSDDGKKGVRLRAKKDGGDVEKNVRVRVLKGDDAEGAVRWVEDEDAKKAIRIIKSGDGDSRVMRWIEDGDEDVEKAIRIIKSGDGDARVMRWLGDRGAKGQGKRFGVFKVDVDGDGEGDGETVHEFHFEVDGDDLNLEGLDALKMLKGMKGARAFAFDLDGLEGLKALKGMKGLRAMKDFGDMKVMEFLGDDEGARRIAIRVDGDAESGFDFDFDHDHDGDVKIEKRIEIHGDHGAMPAEVREMLKKHGVEIGDLGTGMGHAIRITKDGDADEDVQIFRVDGNSKGAKWVKKDGNVFFEKGGEWVQKGDGKKVLFGKGKDAKADFWVEKSDGGDDVKVLRKKIEALEKELKALKKALKKSR